MQNLKEKILIDAHLRKYSDLIERVAKVEFASIGAQHLIEFDELISIGLQTINILYHEKNFNSYNESYLATAVKWAIRNELRCRYRWYGYKQQVPSDEAMINDTRDAIYKTILSADELFDMDKAYEIKDSKKNPEEKCEFSMFAESIKTVVASLPRRERELIESKFFKEQKLYEISDEFSISPSRISRIIKSGLDKIKDELIKNEIL